MGTKRETIGVEAGAPERRSQRGVVSESQIAGDRSEMPGVRREMSARALQHPFPNSERRKKEGQAAVMAASVGPRVYSCSNCQNPVCLHDDIISKSFFAASGRAYLFSHAMNIALGPKEDRHLITGIHTVADIYCGECNQVLGWKYVRAYEASQKYKEGKFIFEKAKIVKNW
ncbi:protein yippee-like [Canna indica]|uniref:Protein yippee-like n=1 Tax=Canna indica TaxID=4628 RepID=A0AAQ3QNU4_9LILI|nr:protein yippee-like [Canna indica]